MLTARIALFLGLLAPGLLFGASTALKCSVRSGLTCHQLVFETGKHLVCEEHQPVVSRTFYLVDENTYRGWQTYETFCAFCHEKDARGPKNSNGIPFSKKADEKVNCRPHNLLVASELNEFSSFEARLDSGYPRQDEECLAGESKNADAKNKTWTLRMPRWGNVALVKRNYSNVYGYLIMMREMRLPPERKERLHRLSKSDLQSLSCAE